MSSRRAPPPAIPPGTSLAKIKRLSAAALQLYLDQYHLAQDGTKADKAKRLYDHLQANPAPTTSSSSGSESDPGSDPDSRSGSGTDRGTDSGSGSASSNSDGDEQTDAPFTKAQQKALAKTIRSAMRVLRVERGQGDTAAPLSLPPQTRPPGDTRAALHASSTPNALATPPVPPLRATPPHQPLCPPLTPHLPVIGTPTGLGTTATSTITTTTIGGTSARPSQSHAKSDMRSNEVSL